MGYVLPEEQKELLEDKMDQGFSKEEAAELLRVMSIEDEMDDELREILQRTDSTSIPRENKIAVPEAMATVKDYVGKIYGYIRPDSGYHCILGWDGNMPIPELKTSCIGAVEAAGPESVGPWIRGVHDESGALTFFIVEGGMETPIHSEPYALQQEIFSRNAGLMESDWMRNKCVIISGCGSVGGTMALQLARSGVGKFVLVDSDCVEIHNICRHCCNLTDLGRYKVDAVADRILQINPNAEIRKFRSLIQDVCLDDYADWLSPRDALFIGTCDNRIGNAYANDIAISVGAPFLSLGFMARAWGGEIFIFLPERHDVCYRCAFRNQIDRAVRAEHLLNYMDADDVGRVTVEPGLDVDLEYGISLADKIVLDIINRYNSDYRFRILNTLTQFTVFSGTADRTGIEEGWSKMLEKPLDYKRIGIRSSLRRSDCPYCKRFL